MPSASTHNARDVKLARRLLVWYRRHRRDLPWRRTHDPYRIWVSEIMLQQTRIGAVIPYYQRFLERFPTVEALAKAPEEELLERWSGLGYYRRARQMQAAAKSIAGECGGRFPTTHDELLSLPGIGTYTAAAIASIAFGLPHAVVDGNVIRVLSRLFDDDRDTASSATRASIADHAQRLLERAGKSNAGDFNQAMMELGATLCTPRGPQCLLCPVAEHCLAYRRGCQEQRPVKKRKEKNVELHLLVALVERDEKLLMRQRPMEERIMPGFWELPQAESTAYDPGCLTAQGIHCDGQVGQFRHGITFRAYRGVVHRATLKGRPRRGYHWISKERLATLPVSTVTRKALAAAYRHVTDVKSSRRR